MFTGADAVLPKSALTSNYITQFATLKSMGDAFVGALAGSIGLGDTSGSGSAPSPSASSTATKASGSKSSASPSASAAAGKGAGALALGNGANGGKTNPAKSCSSGSD